MPARRPADSTPDAGVVVRRAPFSDNPQVGARGQQTQQRILDAALRVFGDVGYHQARIEAIAEVAGCSRVSFYQYFSSKEDVFRHLAVTVARQLDASTDRLDPVTPDTAGWQAVRAWAARYADTYERYEPVFHAFPAAAESDTALADDSVRTANRYVAGIVYRIAGAPLGPRELDPVVELLRQALSRTLADGAVLRAAAPRAYGVDRLLDAYTDMFHRTLFGLDADVNVHLGRGPRPPKLPPGPMMEAITEQADGRDGAGARPALAALLAAARDVFVARGYHGTRVDDIVEAAGVSHGAFYRYFKNKDELARLLAGQAMRTIASTFTEVPDLSRDDDASRQSLRRWLRSYNRAQVSEAAMIRVWVEASFQDDLMLTDSAYVLDWGRRRMVHVLDERGFGDPEIDAVVLQALIDGFGERERVPRSVEAAVRIIEQGFLGRADTPAEADWSAV